MLVIAIALGLVWFLAWAHPLYPPDEGRYGAVADAMAYPLTGAHADWLVPHFRGQAHLTKPPLTYWLQAAALLAIGRNELAVRLPGLMATTLTLLCLFGFARHVLGTRPAVLAVALAAVMPCVLLVGRLATTDALLACAWFAALATGYLIIEHRAPRAALSIFWLAIAAAFCIKGPVGFAPLLTLIAWCSISGRTRALSALRMSLGLPLALLPLGFWIGAVAHQHPEAGGIWWDETFGRVGGAKHLREQPWWFYLPIFMGGMYPATTMLVLPGFNLRGWLRSARDVWVALSSGDLRALLLIAVLLPILGFSLSAGKMPTYLLPVAPTTALLVAITLERWLRGEYDKKIEGFRAPDVRRTFAVVAAVTFLVEIGAALYVRSSHPQLWLIVLAMAITPISAFALWAYWERGPKEDWLRNRERGFVFAWAGLVAGWMLLFAVESRATPSMGGDAVVQQARALLATPTPVIITVGFTDPTISFYNLGMPTIELEHLSSLDALQAPNGDAVILMRASQAYELFARDPEMSARLQPGGSWTKWFARPIQVFVLRGGASRS
ncbi:MAG: glycosyltransferase family 39 protein [Phycisphaerae bacterium]|nr:glycosyltransferase family 39 protein [Phycisphaerae bacterium]